MPLVRICAGAVSDDRIQRMSYFNAHGFSPLLPPQIARHALTPPKTGHLGGEFFVEVPGYSE